MLYPLNKIAIQLHCKKYQQNKPCYLLESDLSIMALSTFLITQRSMNPENFVPS